MSRFKFRTQLVIYFFITIIFVVVSMFVSLFASFKDSYRDKEKEMLENQAAFLKLFDFMQPAFYPVIGNHEYYVDMFHRESPKPSAEQEFDTWCSHLSGQIGERGPMGSYMLLRPAERVCYITVPCGLIVKLHRSWWHGCRKCFCGYRRDTPAL